MVPSDASVASIDPSIGKVRSASDAICDNVVSPLSFALNEASIVAVV